jgi:hypothetical protein
VPLTCLRVPQIEYHCLRLRAGRSKMRFRQGQKLSSSGSAPSLLFNGDGGCFSGSKAAGREVESKSKNHPIRGFQGTKVHTYSSALSLTSSLDWSGWSRPRLGNDPLPIVSEVGRVSGPVWTGVENLASTVFRSQDRPASSELLYRLNYPRPWGVK